MRPESLFFLFSSVGRLKGVGGATSAALQRLLPVSATLNNGLPVVRDLLFHLPSAIVDRRFTCPIPEAPEGKVATFVVQVEAHFPPPRRTSPYKVVCGNESGSLTLIFFHAPGDWLLKTLPIGSSRVISGRVERFDFHVQMPHPDVIAPIEKLAEVQKAEAVYPLTVGLTSKRITATVAQALETLPDLPEWISGEWARAQNWPGWKAALTSAHRPESEEDLLPTHPARMRLAYDEMLAGQLHLGLLKRDAQAQPARAIAGTGRLTAALLKQLPFTLTEGQREVDAEIAGDLRSGARMLRLLQGDVGSGKTVVALLSMLRAAEEGAQAALMVPTEIIAQQHHATLSRLTEGLGVRTVLLTGSVKGRARAEALAAIESGEAELVVGTQALFQDKVAFADLALAVIDEQHRFGVGQRMALSAKGTAPHILHMTATPIPRSLAMTLYGDMDVSQLRGMPAGRRPIATRVIGAARYEEVMQRLTSALARGEKAYWICPLIDGDETQGDADIAAANARFTEFSARFGPAAGLVHGRMKSEERAGAMRRFAQGDTRLLVATTVVEVGVDIPDATIIVIEQAERFGLSQLHQLRGRVGRGDRPSACVLLYSEKTGAVAQERLSLLRHSEDGFAIAEGDLAQRGGGDLLGRRQSGLPRFIFAQLPAHREVMEQARLEARAALAAGPLPQASSLLLELFGFDSGA